MSNLYFIKKDLNKGILILKEGLSIFPEVLSLRFNLGVMYRNKGDIENSIKTFLEIIKRNNKHYDSFYELSTIYNFSDHKKEKNNF